jgi:hypothetical protein
MARTSNPARSPQALKVVYAEGQASLKSLRHQLHAPRNADWDVGGGMQVQKRLTSLASLLPAGGRHLMSCRLRTSCSCPVLQRWCQRPRDGARLSTHPIRAAGWASTRRCLHLQMRQRSRPRCCCRHGQWRSRSAPDRRGGATAASRGRVAAARRPGSGTATSRGGCPARHGPAASAIGIAAGNVCRDSVQLQDAAQMLQQLLASPAGQQALGRPGSGEQGPLAPTSAGASQYLPAKILQHVT